MKWKRLETHREKRERIQRNAEQEAAEQQRRREEQERHANEAQAFWQAYKHRNESEQAYQIWAAAFERWFADTAPDDRAAAWTLYLLFDGRPADLEPLVGFLERDPWTFGSGYSKADAIRFLKRAPLDDTAKQRLRRVVLNAVDGRDRREFRHYCKLARKVDAPDLRAALRERMTGNDPNVRRRAGWMLAACEQKNERSEHEENHDRPGPAHRSDAADGHARTPERRENLR